MRVVVVHSACIRRVRIVVMDAHIINRLQHNARRNDMLVYDINVYRANNIICITMLNEREILLKRIAYVIALIKSIMCRPDRAK